MENKIYKRIYRLLAIMSALAIMVTGVYSQTSAATAASKPKKATVSVKKRAKKSVTIKINKKGKVSGYQIFIATAKKGKYKQIGATKVMKYKISGLKKEKTYYIKVRAFKTSGYHITYGKYSKAVKVGKYSAYHKKKPSSNKKPSSDKKDDSDNSSSEDAADSSDESETDESEATDASGDGAWAQTIIGGSDGPVVIFGGWIM